jgi:hypothetical protein
LPGLKAMVGTLYEPRSAGQTASALTFAALPGRGTGRPGPDAR